MENARNLNFVLGSVGQTLQSLSAEWKEEIPAIQCLVINKNTGLPGIGVGGFISETNFRKLTRAQQRRIVNAVLERVFAYHRWPEVLAALNLQPVLGEYTELATRAATFRAGGESEAHRQLKEYVAKNPAVVGLSGNLVGEIEYPLPSGDTVDVLFRDRHDWVAVEVKSRISPEADIARGVFQCVKYRAVIEALQTVGDLPQSARAILVLEAGLPTSLVRLKNELGVEVVERVRPT